MGEVESNPTVRVLEYKLLLNVNFKERVKYFCIFLNVQSINNLGKVVDRLA